MPSQIAQVVFLLALTQPLDNVDIGRAILNREIGACG
jgi:hypothetical protein